MQTYLPSVIHPIFSTFWNTRVMYDCWYKYIPWLVCKNPKQLFCKKRIIYKIFMMYHLKKYMRRLILVDNIQNFASMWNVGFVSEICFISMLSKVQTVPNSAILFVFVVVLLECVQVCMSMDKFLLCAFFFSKI